MTHCWAQEHVLPILKMSPMAFIFISTDTLIFLLGTVTRRFAGTDKPEMLLFFFFNYRAFPSSKPFHC